MRTNPLAGFLVVVLVACAIWTSWIMYVYTSSTGKMRALNPQFAYMENVRMTVQSLANEAMQYSKQHPAMDTVLRRYLDKPLGSATPAVPQPQGK